MGIDLEGLNFHCGSAHKGADLNFQVALKEIQSLIKIARQVGHSIKILDVGGGFSGSDLSDSLQYNLK